MRDSWGKLEPVSCGQRNPSSVNKGEDPQHNLVPPSTHVSIPVPQEIPTPTTQTF